MTIEMKNSARQEKYKRNESLESALKDIIPYFQGLSSKKSLILKKTGFQ